MRIGIDIRHLSGQKHTGVEEYTYNLLPALFRLGLRQEDRFFLLYNSFKKPLPKEVRDWKYYPNVEIIELRWPSKILNGLLWSTKKPFLDRLIGDLDVFFFPNIAFASISPSVPFVTTFHDLSYAIMPNLFNFYRRLWHFLVNPRKLAERSSAIITVSQSTAADVNCLFKIPGDKINSIYLGLDEIFLKSWDFRFQIPSPGKTFPRDEPGVKKYYNLPGKPFVLYLGTLEPRKNIINIIEAFEYFKYKTRSPHKLVIAGAPGWSYKKIFERAKHSVYRQSIYFPGPIHNLDRPALYKMADVFVFPSFVEGFGLPPLEAMAQGVPVICSSSSSLLEILGSHALLVNPYDIGELAWVMERAISDSNLRKSLIKKGIAYAQNFNWGKTAAATLSVLHNAASKT
jgi:glycosyltransferase involved in cell wall biosynthesis